MNIAIILNWKAPKETIECAESIISNCPSVHKLIIIDNASPDDSFSKLKTWQSQNPQAKKSATVIQNSQNSGFAGGNNFGIEWALQNFSDAENFWIVNNDTFFTNDAFAPLLKALKDNPLNFYGSTIINAESRRIECWGGGRIYPLLGKAKLSGKGQPATTSPPEQHHIDYLMGCSLACSKEVIIMVGLMDERYFMYSEEVDWQWRAKAQGVGIKHIPQSIVYHVGSMSSGGKSDFYYFYRNRAAIMLNKRFFGRSMAIISALNLSAITILQEFKHPSKWISGVKGAFSGLTMDFQ